MSEEIISKINRRGSDVKPWVSLLSFKMQAVLLSALRGCDGRSKHDPSKPFGRKLRGVLLWPADPNYVNNANDSYMRDNVTVEVANAFLSDLDSYPLHYITHLMHAAEIVGYKHPHEDHRRFWMAVYMDICNRLHVNIERESQLDERLADAPAKPDSAFTVTAIADLGAQAAKETISDGYARLAEQLDRQPFA
jgi:hypothetical protein